MQHTYSFTVLALDKIFSSDKRIACFFSAPNPIFRNNPENFHSNSDNFCYKTFRYETVNIHLRSKPEWFAKDINPLGKVPTFQIDDKIVYDSEICNEYIDEVYPGDESVSLDPYQRAKDRMLLEHFPKVIFCTSLG